MRQTLFIHVGMGSINDCFSAGVELASVGFFEIKNKKESSLIQRKSGCQAISTPASCHEAHVIIVIARSVATWQSSTPVYGWCYDFIINTCFEVEDCHVAVSTAPRNDNEKGLVMTMRGLF